MDNEERLRRLSQSESEWLFVPDEYPKRYQSANGRYVVVPPSAVVKRVEQIIRRYESRRQ